MLVYLADKDPYDLLALKAGLDEPGREIVILEDGEKVVEESRLRPPDAVVVGSSLGKMGGLAVSRELKTLADLGEIPPPRVVVMLEREADAWVAGWSRCDAFLIKPVEAAEVDAQLQPQPLGL